jgi:solute carrier family 6 GABA transporter-like protein 1
LNVIVGQGKNWKIPAFMPFLLRYLSGPVLAIILSFAFPEFHTLRYDPMMIAGFILSILTIIVILLGLVMPRYYDAFVPVHRRSEGTEPTVPMQNKGELAGKPIAETVAAEQGGSSAVRDSSSEQDMGDEKHVKTTSVK